MSFWIDGVDARTIGLIDANVEGHIDGMDVDHTLARIPGRDGRVPLGIEHETRERRIDLSGAITRTTRAAVIAARQELLWRIQNRIVELATGDLEAEWYINAEIESPRLPSIAPSQTQRMTHTQFVFVCSDPLWYSVTESTIDFNAGATQTPLSNARVRPRIVVVGPISAPWHIIYNNSSAVEQSRMTFNTALAAGETCEIDCLNKTITLDGDHSFVEALDDDTDFIVLDPRDGVWGGAQPTLTMSPAGAATTAEAIYRKAWG